MLNTYQHNGNIAFAVLASKPKVRFDCSRPFQQIFTTMFLARLHNSFLNIFSVMPREKKCNNMQLIAYCWKKYSRKNCEGEHCDHNAKKGLYDLDRKRLLL
jgi:hypothetical protein